MLVQILFYAFALVLVGAALGMIIARNPVHAALALVMCFVTSAAIWLLIGAEFLAVVLVLVYVGAVMVLFLFVVMMLDINLEEIHQGFTRFAWLGWITAGAVIFEIVGVIDDFKNDGVKEPVAPQVFLPDGVSDFGPRAVLVRTAGEPLALLNAVRQTIWTQDRAIALNEGASLQDYVTRIAYAAPRFSLLVLGVFAGVGLVLVVLGVYSVTTYAVTRQTREFGVRMALGAQASDILRLVLTQGFGLVVLGLACGAGASLAVTRVLASQLWDVSPYDAPTLCGVAGIVALVGLAACYFPARRATRVDPLVALRHE